MDTLSDKGFPVEHTRIVGNGLRTVEYVTGGSPAAAPPRRGRERGVVRAAGRAAARAVQPGLVVARHGIGCTLIGAAWWAVFGYFAHRATRGRRDFSSIKGLEAEQYAVYVDADRADEAIRLAGLF